MTVREEEDARPLGIIPSFLTQPQDAELLGEAVETFLATTVGADLLVVDDGSPAHDLYDAVSKRWTSSDVEFVKKDTNEGFSRTVNVGLQRALDEGRDAVLINADITFHENDWLERMLETENLHSDGLAGVAGALLIYPQNGLIQHGGVYFSLLTRQFWHRWQHAPQNLPEAQVPTLCPVTGALQLIRHETLETVGLYDEEFRLGWEDMDYCIRTFKAGIECVYNPLVRALHAESVFRGRPDPQKQRWQQESFARLVLKYQDQSFAGLVPSW
jgi:GT2 family glycosyltransferase